MNYFHTFDEMAAQTQLWVSVSQHPHHNVWDRIAHFTVQGLPELSWNTGTVYNPDETLTDEEGAELLSVVNRIIGGMTAPDRFDTLGQLRYLSFCMTCSLENAPPDAAQVAVNYLEGYLAALKAEVAREATREDAT